MTAAAKVTELVARISTDGTLARWVQTITDARDQLATIREEADKLSLDLAGIDGSGAPRLATIARSIELAESELEVAEAEIDELGSP